ncbi:hypothetical protein [Haliangium sp.]|uniref:hypothetical protein n=1 Tax=Haliangium sp. TaxID=2663208 RepID=UPI003D1391AB
MIAFLLLSAALLGLHLFTPWWWWVLVLPAVYGAGWADSGRRAAGTGAAAAGLVWTGASVWALVTDADLVAGRVAAMLGLSSPWLLVAAAGLGAAIAAGLAAATGHAAMAALRPRD